MSRSFSVVTICKILIFQSTHPLTNCQNCVLLNMRNFAIISLLPPFLSLCPFVTQRPVVWYTFGGLLDHAEGMTDLNDEPRGRTVWGRWKRSSASTSKLCIYQRFYMLFSPLYPNFFFTVGGFWNMNFRVLCMSKIEERINLFVPTTGALEK